MLHISKERMMIAKGLIVILFFGIIGGCAGVNYTSSYRDVADGDPMFYVGKPLYVVASKEETRKKCGGFDACIEWKGILHEIAVIYHPVGNVCLKEHEEKHLKKGPNHSKVIIWC